MGFDPELELAQRWGTGMMVPLEFKRIHDLISDCPASTSQRLPT